MNKGGQISVYLLSGVPDEPGFAGIGIKDVVSTAFLVLVINILRRPASHDHYGTTASNKGVKVYF